jgi:hypothetical protein
LVTGTSMSPSKLSPDSCPFELNLNDRLGLSPMLTIARKIQHLQGQLMHGCTWKLRGQTPNKKRQEGWSTRMLKVMHLFIAWILIDSISKDIFQICCQP